MFQALVLHVFGLSQYVPLPVFTALGSLLEELVWPIPGQAVMLLAGSLARSAGAGILLLCFIALTGAVGKVAGCLLYYVFADKIEDVIMPRYGKYFGITHEQLERVGKKLGRGWKDDVALLILRLLSPIPSAFVSIACGLFKIDLKTFIVTSFIGSYLRNILFLFIGYYGWAAYQRFLESFRPYLPFIGSLVGVFCLAGGIVGYWFWKKRKRAERES